MTDLGEVNHILGLRVLCSEGQISIDQSYYIENILRKFGMDKCNPVSTPMETNCKLLPVQENENTVNIEEYRSAVGALNYIAMVTRPDIATAVAKVARFVQKPGNSHWTAVKRIMRYLRGTTDFGLVYKKDITDNDPILEVYVDTDFAGDPVDRKSTSGFVVKLNGTAVSWKSGKQDALSYSTLDAEYIAAGLVTKEVIWLRRLLKKLGLNQSEPTIIKIDNDRAKDLANN